VIESKEQVLCDLCVRSFGGPAAVHGSFPDTKHSVRVAWRRDFTSAPKPGSDENDRLTGNWEIMTVPTNYIPNNQGQYSVQHIHHGRLHDRQLLRRRHHQGRYNDNTEETR